MTTIQADAEPRTALPGGRGGRLVFVGEAVGHVPSVTEKRWIIALRPLGIGRIVTSPFGPRDDGFHAGTDFGFPGGSANKPVYACASGTVIYAGAAQG